MYRSYHKQACLGFQISKAAVTTAVFVWHWQFANWYLMTGPWISGVLGEKTVKTRGQIKREIESRRIDISITQTQSGESDAASSPAADFDEQHGLPETTIDAGRHITEVMDDLDSSSRPNKRRKQSHGDCDLKDRGSASPHRATALAANKNTVKPGRDLMKCRTFPECLAASFASDQTLVLPAQMLQSLRTDDSGRRLAQADEMNLPQLMAIVKVDDTTVRRTLTRFAKKALSERFFETNATLMTMYKSSATSLTAVGVAELKTKLGIVDKQGVAAARTHASHGKFWMRLAALFQEDLRDPSVVLIAAVGKNPQ